MRYMSTRGAAAPLEFEDVLLAGLAADGGLYVPMVWPQLDEDRLRALRGLPYAEVAYHVLSLFCEGVGENALRGMIRRAYEGFTHQCVAPLVQLDSQVWLMELFHGPTLAFKDIALQLLGHLFDHVLAKRGKRMTIIGATSGDTGSAAIQACKGRDNIDIFILHPRGRVSDVQRKQMTTVQDKNVFNLAIDGTFDDCQELVKGLFNNEVLRAELNLGAINSINWARIMAQIVYYVYAAVNLGGPDRGISFAVPTGNFGNIYAAYGAHRMGLPIARLICASNANDILTRFYETGTMRAAPVISTLSPSMDIQISSNFERLLFELVDRKPGEVVRMLATFRAAKAYDVSPSQHRKFAGLFAGARADDSLTLATITRIYKETGRVVDPHTAVALSAVASGRFDAQFPVVSVATAHPAKFADAVFRAIGQRPALPPQLERQMLLPERCTTMNKDYTSLVRFIRTHARVGA